MRSTKIRILVAAALASCLGCSALRPGRAEREESTVAFRVTYAFTAAGKTNWARVVALVPKTIPGRQTISGVQLSPQPVRVFDIEGSRYAEFFFSHPPSNFEVQVSGRARLVRHDLATARAMGRPAPPSDLARYLLHEPALEKDDPKIAAAAATLRRPDELETVRAIYDYVKAHMQHTGFNRSAVGGGAINALESGKGDCTDYADLMIALCRAAGIPARHVLGLLAVPKVDVPQHSWVEAWTRDYGWVPFDPTVDDCGGRASFDRLPPAYLRFSTVRNDEVLDNYISYALYRWWGDRIELKDAYEIEPIP